MSPEERGWIAGFYEGEGCCSTTGRANSGRLRISIGQKQRAPLDKVQRLTGLGKVIGPYKHGAHMFNIYKQAHVKEFVDLIYDLLSEEKKIQIDRNLNV